MIPKGFIQLASKRGTELLDSAITKFGLITRMYDQINRTYCGPVSLAIACMHLYESTHISNQWKDKTVSLKDEKDFVENTAAGQYLVKAGLHRKGVTLQTLANASLTMERFNVSQLYCFPKDKDRSMPDKLNHKILTSCDELRKLLLNELRNRDVCLIANYHMGDIGWEGCQGHFSPIAAYHQVEDIVLILDVWPDTPAGWVPTASLFDAIVNLDLDSNMPRGFLRIELKD